MEFVSEALLALHHGLGARLSRWQLVGAGESCLLARSADRSDLIALIWRVKKKSCSAHGGREEGRRWSLV
jgi:hypothetical protein